MKLCILLASTAVSFCACLSAPLLAAPAPTNDSPPGVAAISALGPATTCQADVQAFHRELEKGRYWLGGSDYGYGYAMGGMAYGEGYFAGGYDEGDAMGSHLLRNAFKYRNARPGYEVRLLLESANILAQNGQQQGCEDILDTTRVIYKVYVADMQERGLHPVDILGWDRKEIAAARPVTAKPISFWSDELLDLSIRNNKNENLGSVEDFITNPTGGKIAYLVVARGGIFDFDSKYVPVPWNDFRVTQGMKFLVLNTTKAVMEAAPGIDRDQALTPKQFDQESDKVNVYWKTHQQVKAVN